MEHKINTENVIAFYNTYTFPSGIKVATSSFDEIENGVNEHHLVFTSKDCNGSVKNKIDEILQAYKTIKEENFLGENLQPVFCRWFLSDMANQAFHVDYGYLSCATSIIEQAPADGSKVALWVYCQNNILSEKIGDNFFSISHGSYRHLWQGDITSTGESSRDETVNYLLNYSNNLKENGCSLLNNCIRTWFFVRDIDTNYKGVVTGRNNVFEYEGLIPSTHFIASTGIEGRKASTNEKVAFNAYAVDGIEKDQVKYLKASSHLNPTFEYGVAFERGTAIDYGDRRHVFISGTASIDNKGKIMHPENVDLQFLRMCENVEALLEESETSWHNVGQIIVYLRDISDYAMISDLIKQKFPDIPSLLVHAPVCRPGWLIEMECMACKPQECLKFMPY